MAWDPRRPFSSDGYRLHVQTVARETHHGLRTPDIGRQHPPLWWVNREIRVFWEAAIPQQTVDLIIEAINERIEEVGLVPFSFVQLGDHSSAREQVTTSTVRGQLDEKRLFPTALTEVWRNEKCGGRQHADVYITTKSFLDDTVSWGAADYKYGTMMFALYGQRHQSHAFLRKVALHETNHLLGMYCHCDDYQNVAGLPYTPRCNMHYSCSHSELCPKCLDFLRNWWAQVEYEHEQDGVQGLAVR